MEQKTLSPKEAAEYIGIHVETLYKMVRQKEVPHIRIRRRIFFSRETIDKWMRELELKSLEAI